MTDPVTPPRPWWASLLTSALTTLSGLALIAIAVVLVRPALSDSQSEIWIGLVFAGAGMAGVGGSLLSRSPRPPDERGLARVDAMLVISGTVLFVGLAWAVSGCASREILTRDPIAIEYWEGPPCRVVIHAGDEEPYIVRNPAGSGLRCVVAPSGGQ